MLRNKTASLEANGITETNGGSVNEGKAFIGDSAGKLAGRVLETDGAKLDKCRSVTPTDTEPTDPAEGDWYFDDGTNTATTTPAIRQYISGAWVDLDTGGGGDVSPMLRAELDDLTYRLAVKSFSDFGYRVANTFGTPLGYQSYFETIDADGPGPDTENSYWFGRSYTVGGTTPELVLWDDSVANLPAARWLHSQSTLDGKLYVCGGQDASSVTKSDVYCYDPVGNSWSSVASLPAARWYHSHSTLDGKLYVCGGADASSVVKSDVYCYDPTVNSWSSVASLPAARRYHSQSTLDGKLYVCGGADASSVTLSSMLTTVPQTGPGGVLESAHYALDFEVDRITAFAWIDRAMKLVEGAWTDAVYGTDWDIQVSADGINWTALTIRPVEQVGDDMMYGGEADTVTPGEVLAMKITANADTVLRVRGWQRYGGQA